MDLPMTDAEYNQAYHDWLVQEQESALWHEEIVQAEMTDEKLAWMLAIESKLGPYEDPDEYLCRQDPESLVDSAYCADCPLNTDCFALIEMDVADARRKIQDLEA
jgi:hypothetical protein